MIGEEEITRNVKSFYTVECVSSTAKVMVLKREVRYKLKWIGFFENTVAEWGRMVIDNKGCNTEDENTLINIFEQSIVNWVVN